MRLEKGLGELKNYLPYGYAQLFADRFKCSVSKAYKVANGKLTDFRMLKAMKEEAMANLEIESQILKTNKKIAQ
ncbi:hypothetical protein LJC68_06080 [Bacteroidales bacterium OttesenSCG-928-B11]|nr:hypothetical protein [Bacteroidales bacterium OttesenSCG-928-B11]